MVVVSVVVSVVIGLLLLLFLVSKAVGEDAPHAVKIEGGEGKREGEVIAHCLGSLWFVVATQ